MARPKSNCRHRVDTLWCCSKRYDVLRCVVFNSAVNTAIMKLRTDCYRFTGLEEEEIMIHDLKNLPIFSFLPLRQTWTIKESVIFSVRTSSLPQNYPPWLKNRLLEVEYVVGTVFHINTPTKIRPITQKFAWRAEDIISLFLFLGFKPLLGTTDLEFWGWIPY